ncbi:MAG TPA: prolipoprotein diacylglyceryl transferase [Nitrospirae bacterium]|nr:prolipoprotein diacylglyceryl transferase [Nitrospirota bacterium]
MIEYPNISPEILKIGPFAIRWYGLMYLIGFMCSYLLVRFLLKERKIKYDKDFVESLFSYLIIGLLIGARLGYVIFYNLSHYLQHPLEIFAIWYGGMSFHGGLIGAVIGGILFCKKFRIDFWQTSDIIILTAPIGIGLGRIGNFINAELYGRPTNSPLAMIFPTDPLRIPRHPSQLYEFFFEGVVLFIILWSIRNKNLPKGAITSLFIGLYGVFRFFIEFFREPDGHIGYFFGFITLGQILCILMIITAFILNNFIIRLNQK